MEAGSAVAPQLARVPRWLVGVLPLVLLAAAIAAFVALDAPGLDRRGVPVEELAVERTTLRPGEIELHLRNAGPDPVRVEQVIVNDRFAQFLVDSESLGRLEDGVVRIDYPWIEGESYAISLLTATGATVPATIEAATETPPAGASFYGLMALIGVYVGVIPVAVGMLWLPWARRIDRRWIRFLLALTVGLLAWLGLDAVLEGVELAGAGAQALGGSALVFLGAVLAYLALAGVDAALARPERDRADSAGELAPGAGSAAGEGRAGGPTAPAPASAFRLALLVALGIGLHNLGEGLAIGSAYAVGSLALGASLIVGFALHNTTEGLAIVAPVAESESAAAPPLRRLALLGVLAGAPVIAGAWIGALAFDPSLAAFMFGLGAGAIVRVVVQIAPALRDRGGRLLDPLVAGGAGAGLLLMYATGLLVSI